MGSTATGAHMGTAGAGSIRGATPQVLGDRTPSSFFPLIPAKAGAQIIKRETSRTGPEKTERTATELYDPGPGLRRDERTSYGAHRHPSAARPITPTMIRQIAKTP